MGCVFTVCFVHNLFLIELPNEQLRHFEHVINDLSSTSVDKSLSHVKGQSSWVSLTETYFKLKA